MSESKLTGVRLPIDWHVPGDLRSQYATNLVVQHTENEFILSFFELHPPTVLGSPEQQKGQLEALGEVRAECVARVIIAAARMESFVRAMRTNLEAFRARTDEEE